MEIGVRRDRRGAAYVAAVLAIFGWGSLYPAAKLALQDVTPLMIALARTAIAAVVLGGLSCAGGGGLRPGLRRLRREATRRWREPCLLGLVSFLGTSVMAMTAQAFLPAAINSLLNNLGPLWLALYAVLAGRARHAPLLLAGSTVAIAGVAAVLLGELPFGGVSGSAQGQGTGPGQGPAAAAHSLVAVGAALSLGGSLLIAYSNLLARRVMAGRDPLATTAVAAAWASVPLGAALALGVGGSLPAYAATSSVARGLLLWLGVASTAFNFSLWYFALAHLPVTRIANLQYLIPPLGVALAVIVLGEPAGPGLIAGTLAIVGGIALA
ncbi:MAG TPA: DMT family transporter, partial [Chloroflexota bacterium]|nr:DMT family transporter [Chloroflexota bacterium]